MAYKNALIKTRAANQSIYAATKAVDPADVGAQQGGLYDWQRRNQTDSQSKHYREFVYDAIQAIVRRVTCQPWCVGDPLAAINGQRTPSIRTKNSSGYYDMPVIRDHPALEMLAQPNPLQSHSEFLEMTISSLYIHGEAYWVGGVVGKDTDSEKVELYAMPTGTITAEHKGDEFFTGYYLNKGTAKTKYLPPSNVKRLYFPDPASLIGCYAPLRACLLSSTVDAKVMRAADTSFSRGPDPNLLVTVGKVPLPDGSLSDTRPVLDGSQRRQITRAIQQAWQMAGAGRFPAIIDGMIESVHKLDQQVGNMGYDVGGQITQERIFLAFGVNPISAGKIQPGNRAQAVEAEKQITKSAVNPTARKISNAMTSFLGDWYEPRVVMYLEPATPIDPAQKLAEWDTGLRNKAVTKNEYRREILGLEDIAGGDEPPSDPAAPNPLVDESDSGGNTDNDPNAYPDDKPSEDLDNYSPPDNDTATQPDNKIGQTSAPNMITRDFLEGLFLKTAKKGEEDMGAAFARYFRQVD